MLFIVAAGNGDASGNGYSIDEQPMYPASFELDNIISVANLRFDGQLDRASNYGAVSYTHLDVYKRQLTIFALQDSFGTACNVTGDGALTLMLTG